MLKLIILTLTFSWLLEYHFAFDDETDAHFHGVDQHNKISTPMPKDKILLREIQVLTFARNKKTTSRRTHPIYQLSCVGGTAGCRLFSPNFIECHNDGIDKAISKPKWKCHADMSDRVTFNHIDVICEGYDYAEDDYILVGSCGLEFTLDYTDPLDHHDKSYYKHMDEDEKDMYKKKVVKEMHKQGMFTDKQSWFDYFYHLFIRRSMIILSVVILCIIIFILRHSSTINRTKAHQDSKNRKRPLNSGYGPLTSAVLTTKKAC